MRVGAVTRYVRERQLAAERELAFRVYVTDALRAYMGIDQRYYDRIYERPEIDVDAVIDRVARGSGLEVVG